MVSCSADTGIDNCQVYSLEISNFGQQFHSHKTMYIRTEIKIILIKKYGQNP